MATFRFQLDPLLEIRRREEREQQRVVGELERRRVEIERRMHAYGAQMDTLKGGFRELAAHGGGSVDTDGVRAQLGASLHTERRIREAAIGLAGVHRKLEAARARLAEASRARRMLERLREQRYEAWRREMDKREVDALDELATVRWARGGEL